MRKTGATLPQVCLSLIKITKGPDTAFTEELNQIVADPKDFYKSFGQRLNFLLKTLN